MKRRYSQNEITFNMLPLELKNKIHSLLETKSLIRLGNTCKHLYEIRKNYMQLEETNLYKECIQRVRIDLEKKRLSKLVENFVAKFKSVIRGLYLNSLLMYDTGVAHGDIRIEIDQSVNIYHVIDYIKDNIDHQEYIFSESYYTIELFNKRDETLCVLRIEYTDFDDIYNGPECDFGYAKCCTDLRKVYCKNVWKLLK